VPTSQFGAPSGLQGRLAVHVVARLTGEANRWMVDCLDVGAHDRMLDVGCGPGLAVAHAAGLTRGLVVGVDASPAMVRHAARRNRAAAREGLVEIRRADAALLPYPDAHFTAAGSLNSLQFWPAPGRGLGELYRVLAPGGRVAVILMARSDDPPGAGLPAWLETTADDMRAAGFARLEAASRTFGGVVHRALLGFRPPGKQKSGAPLDPTADGVRKGAALSIRTVYGMSSRNRGKTLGPRWH
jgi:SAM-dependent methyltransferase